MPPTAETPSAAIGEAAPGTSAPAVAETPASPVSAKPVRGQPMHMPDRDNPFLWRARTKEGRRGAVRLLQELTDEEVTRYMEMASDQVRLEERWMGLQLLAAATAIGLVIYDMADGLKNGLTGIHVAGLLLGAALGYWPWRVRACRRMWLKHQNAAKAELHRRAAAT